MCIKRLRPVVDVFYEEQHPGEDVQAVTSLSLADVYQQLLLETVQYPLTFSEDFGGGVFDFEPFQGNADIFFQQPQGETNDNPNTFPGFFDVFWSGLPFGPTGGDSMLSEVELTQQLLAEMGDFAQQAQAYVNGPSQPVHVDINEPYFHGLFSQIQSFVTGEFSQPPQGNTVGLLSNLPQGNAGVPIPPAQGSTGVPSQESALIAPGQQFVSPLPNIMGFSQHPAVGAPVFSFQNQENTHVESAQAPLIASSQQSTMLNSDDFSQYIQLALSEQTIPIELTGMHPADQTQHAETDTNGPFLQVQANGFSQELEANINEQSLISVPDSVATVEQFPQTTTGGFPQQPQGSTNELSEKVPLIAAIQAASVPPNLIIFSQNGGPSLPPPPGYSGHSESPLLNISAFCQCPQVGIVGLAQQPCEQNPFVEGQRILFVTVSTVPNVGGFSQHPSAIASGFTQMVQMYVAGAKHPSLTNNSEQVELHIGEPPYPGHETFFQPALASNWEYCQQVQAIVNGFSQAQTNSDGPSLQGQVISFEEMLSMMPEGDAFCQLLEEGMSWVFQNHDPLVFWLHQVLPNGISEEGEAVDDSSQVGTNDHSQQCEVGTVGQAPEGLSHQYELDTVVLTKQAQVGISALSLQPQVSTFGISEPLQIATGDASGLSEQAVTDEVSEQLVGNTAGISQPFSSELPQKLQESPGEVSQQSQISTSGANSSIQSNGN